MKIELNIEKKHLYAIVAIIVLFIGVITVVAYTSDDPLYNGHTITEISGLEARLNTFENNMQNTLNTELAGFIQCPDGLNPYFEWDKSGLYDTATDRTYGTAADTCDGNTNERYTCKPSETKTCTDRYSSTFSQAYVRTVTCTAVKTLVCRS